ncbi:type I-E CRISPR-associated protein Cse2/CasB [Longispora fulva]|nr:type I-E CRISPR-associated protein Cse2/CasB [Longispora fulva]
MDYKIKERYWQRRVGPDHAWREHGSDKGPPPGEDLAAMRSGLGRPPMDSPKMWALYTCPVNDMLARRGEVSAEQAAEHAALSLFGLHQQGEKVPMHRQGVGLGTALLALRRHEKFSDSATDARVGAMAAATSVPALLRHLRSLITQLRVISQPVDYTQLMADIQNWHHPDRRPPVRRRWALDYRVWTHNTPDPKAPTAPAAE